MDGNAGEATGNLMTCEREANSTMKVSDIMGRITDIESCQNLLIEWMEGKITDPNRIEVLVEEIGYHLDDYIELLKNKEVK